MGNLSNKKPEQFRLPVDLVEALDAYPEASGMSKTDIVEMALREQMAKGIESRLDERVKAVRKLGVSRLSRAIRHAQQSGQKQKAESPSENKASRAGGETAGIVSEMLGNSERILKRDYKALVTRAEAEEFWKVVQSFCARR